MIRRDFPRPLTALIPALRLSLFLSLAGVVAVGCMLPRPLVGSSVTRVRDLTIEGAQLVQPGKETSLRVRIGVGPTTQALSFAWTKAELTLANPTLLSAPKTLVVNQAGGEAIIGEFKALRPGSGYSLAITLYDGTTEVASGSNATITLGSGANSVQVTVNTAGGTPTPSPSPSVLPPLNFSVTTVAGLLDPAGVSARSWPINLVDGYTYGSVRDSQGNLYINDPGNHMVYKLTPAGNLHKVAGLGFKKFSGDGGLAVNAGLDDPMSLAIDSQDNLYISQYNPARIRFVPATAGTYFGQTMTAGHIYTVAGSGGAIDANNPYLSGPALSSSMGYINQIAADAAGNLFMAFANSPARIGVLARSTGTLFGGSVTEGNLYSFLGNNTFNQCADASVAWSNASAGMPTGLGFDATGNLLFVDYLNGRVHMVPRNSGTYFGQSMTANRTHTLVTGLSYPRAIGVAADGSFALGQTQVRFRPSTGGTYFGQGMLSNQTYIIAGTGTSTPLVDGAARMSANLNPLAMSVDAQHNLIGHDPTNKVLEMIVNASGTYYGRPMTAGNVYEVAGNGSMRRGPDTHSALKSPLSFPSAVAMGPSGNLYVADRDNQRIRKIAPDGTLTTLATLPNVQGLWVDANETVYAAEGSSHRVSKISPTGVVTSIAGTGTTGNATDGTPASTAAITNPQALVGDNQGNLYVAEGIGGTGNGRRVRRIDLAADLIYVAAGNGGTTASNVDQLAGQASFNSLRGLARDPAGNLYLADQSGHLVRKITAQNGIVDTSCTITTLAGNGTAGASLDGSTAAGGMLRNPRAVAIGTDGTVLILDGGNHSVRRITDGKLYTVAGGLTTIADFADGSLGTDARFNIPQAMVITPRNELYVAEVGNGAMGSNLIRKLTPR